MKRYQAFVGRILVVLPLTQWQADQDGRICMLSPGEYLITSYSDHWYTVQRDGMDYQLDADAVIDRGYILEMPTVQ